MYFLVCASSLSEYHRAKILFLFFALIYSNTHTQTQHTYTNGAIETNLLPNRRSLNMRLFFISVNLSLKQSIDNNNSQFKIYRNVTYHTNYNSSVHAKYRYLIAKGKKNNTRHYFQTIE